MPLPRCPGRTRMHHADQTGRSSTWGIIVDRAKGSSDPGAIAAQPTTSTSSYARTPGATRRPQSFRTYSPQARPTSSRLIFESTRWLRHQHTEELGFFGPSMIATSSNRATVAGRISMLMAGCQVPSGAEATARLLRDQRLLGPRLELLHCPGIAIG